MGVVQRRQADVRIIGGYRWRILLQNRRRDGEMTPSFECTATSDRFVQHRTECKYIATSIRILAFDLFWRHARSA
jgi:hypothetical protein